MSSDRPAPCDPPSLPIEVLVMIAEFLAGDDFLGTLAHLNLASRMIHQETLPILYETAVWPYEESSKEEAVPWNYGCWERAGKHVQ
jgi:hypothetical protein